MDSITLKPWEVRGILDGWLTQLVRPAFAKPHQWMEDPAFEKTIMHDGDLLAVYTHRSYDPAFGAKTYTQGIVNIECPFGKPGDVLWVQEPWELRMDNLPGCAYEADWIDTPIGKLAEWKDAEGMPRECSRLSILNVETKVERIKGINYDQNRDDHYDFCRYMRDCAAHVGEHAKEWVEKNIARNVDPDTWNLDYPATPWESNPWVYVATIRKVER
jgi:hypothetical protein